MRRLFSIGKVIQIRTDPHTVKRLAFIETEEHIRHVVEMLTWLYPNAGEKLLQAAELHDIGKKIYLQRDFIHNGHRWDRRLLTDNLREDFFGNSVIDSFQPTEAIQRYLKFIERGRHAKCFVIRKNPLEENSPIIAARYQLDPPFGSHAASIEPDDLQGVPEDEVEYVNDIIKLHHGFQVDKLTAAGARHGDGIIQDLYCLITADHEASRWAEFVVQKLEGGEEIPQGRFGFSEFAVDFIAEPTEVFRFGSCAQGRLRLRAVRRPDLGERTLTVEYHLTECDLNPEKFLSVKRKGGKKK